MTFWVDRNLFLCKNTGWVFKRFLKLFILLGDKLFCVYSYSFFSLFFPPLVTGTSRRKFRGPAESTPACDAKLLEAAQKPEVFTERLNTQNGQRRGGFR